MMPPGAGVRSSRDLRSQLADLHVFFSEVETEKEALAQLDLFSPPSQRRKQRKTFLEPALPAAPFQPQAPAPVPALPKPVAKPRELIFYKPKLDTGARTPIEEANVLAQPLATPRSPSMQCSGVSDGDDSDGEEVSWSAEQARLVGLLCGKGVEKGEEARLPAEPAPAATATDAPQLASPRLSGGAPVIVPRCLEFGRCSVDSGDGTPKIAAGRPAASAPAPTPAAGRSAALSRLKQRSVARQSERVSSSVHRLKQITAMKQRARLAAAASVRSAPPQRAPAPAAPAPPPAPPPPEYSTPAVRQPDVLTESALAPLGAAAVAAAGAGGDTGKRPFLKRRSQAQPMQQMPDWSAVRPKTSSRLDSNLILRQPPAALAARPAAAAAKKPWGNARQGPSPHGSTSTRPLGAARAALGGTKPLSAAQRAARTTTSVVPPPVAAGPSCGPLGAAAATGSHFSSVSAFSGGSSRMGPVRGSAWDPRPDNGGGGGGGTPLDDPLGPLVSQVEHLLSSMEKAIRR